MPQAQSRILLRSIKVGLRHSKLMQARSGMPLGSTLAKMPKTPKVPKVLRTHP